MRLSTVLKITAKEESLCCRHGSPFDQSLRSTTSPGRERDRVCANFAYPAARGDGDK